MKKHILFICVFASFIGCVKRQNHQSYVFVPEKIKTDTMYHIAAMNGDLIYYDSIHVEVRHFPSRYLRWISNDDCIVNIGSDTLTYDEYRNRYCEPIATYTHAQRDTITNTHAPGFYKNRDIGAWALRTILITGYRP